MFCCCRRSPAARVRTQEAMGHSTEQAGVSAILFLGSVCTHDNSSYLEVLWTKTCVCAMLTCPPPPSPLAFPPYPNIRYLSINYPICRFLLKLERREFKAVVLMASQKTLPVSVTVISFLGAIGEEGLMTVPCIIGHMSQLFIDAYISSRWANEREASGANGAAVV